MNRILSWIGLAQKAGKLETGEEPVGAAARARKARLILSAADAADNTRRRAKQFAETGNAEFLVVPFTKEELGNAVGRSSCAVLAFTDAGFAAGLAGKLAQTDPKRYAEAAQALALTADRIEQRKTEARLHEKNIKLQKKRGPRSQAGRDGSRK